MEKARDNECGVICGLWSQYSSCYKVSKLVCWNKAVGEMLFVRLCEALSTARECISKVIAGKIVERFLVLETTRCCLASIQLVKDSKDNIAANKPADEVITCD